VPVKVALFRRAGAEAWHRLANPVLVRFLIVGASGCVVNSAALTITYGMAHFALPIAAALSSEVAIIANYLLNDTWTFRGIGVSWMRFAKFNFVAGVGLGQAALSVWLLVEFLKVEYLLANLAALAFSGVLNFGLSATWIWRRPASGPALAATHRGRPPGLSTAGRNARTGGGSQPDGPGPPPAA
jgi:putative flippase GtrA